MNGKQTTTYPKAKLAQLKMNKGEFIAYSLMSEITWQGGEYVTYQIAVKAAYSKIDNMTNRQLYAFLEDNGYTFNVGDARWYAAETATN